LSSTKNQKLAGVLDRSASIHFRSLLMMSWTDSLVCIHSKWDQSCLFFASQPKLK